MVWFLNSEMKKFHLDYPLKFGRKRLRSLINPWMFYKHTIKFNVKNIGIQLTVSMVNGIMNKKEKRYCVLFTNWEWSKWRCCQTMFEVFISQAIKAWEFMSPPVLYVCIYACNAITHDENMRFTSNFES